MGPGLVEPGDVADREGRDAEAAREPKRTRTEPEHPRSRGAPGSVLSRARFLFPGSGIIAAPPLDPSLKDRSMTDALTLLKKDHRHVEELFERFEHLAKEGLEEGKGDLVADITRQLSIHASIEEQVFYPAVRRALPDGDELAGHLRDDHQEMKEALAALETMEPSELGFDAKARVLISNVRAHVVEEEGQVFPKIEQRLSAETLEEMGGALEKAKRTAPTHPHPKAPSTPPANVIVGPPTAAIDRVRDARPVKKYAFVALAAAVIGLVAWRSLRKRSD
jgi:hemerythrin superfamily protein